MVKDGHWLPHTPKLQGMQMDLRHVEIATRLDLYMGQLSQGKLT